MSGFKVDLDALKDASDGVNGILEAFSSKKVSDIPLPSSAVGHDKLAGALSGFLSGWERGVSNLVTDGKQVAGQLAANLRDYAKAEHVAVAGIHGEFSGTGSDPGER